MNSNSPVFVGPTKCRYCSNTAPMKEVARFNKADDRSFYELLEEESGTLYQLLLCPACGELTLCQRRWLENEGPDQSIPVILYPTEAAAPDGLPPRIASAWQAARAVRAVDANAFGVLSGRVLELVCEDRHAAGSTLAAMLTDLAKRGEIPAQLVEVSTVLKDFRNVAAHAKLGDLTAREVPVVDQLMRAILEYVYSAPALSKKAIDTLRKLKANKDTTSTEEEKE